MLFFILCVSTSLAWATPVNNVYSLEEGPELFETFLNDYNKQYVGKEKEKRLQIFLNNLKEINSLNEESSNAVFGITKFMDLTKEEFLQTYTGLKVNKNFKQKNYEAPIFKPFNYTAPDEFDWRSKGVVSRVKDQGRCLSCWAFSASGNVESINAIKTGSIVEISEQQLIDCGTQSHGCSSGGYPKNALSYLVQNGAMSSESYPYEDNDGSCRFDSNKVVIQLANFEYSQIQEQDLMEKLFTTGPLSIGVDAGPLHKYHGGVIIETCNANDVNHAVLLVGYGQDNGVDYWLIKNSWSESFGESGYFKVKRGVNCLNLVEGGVSTAII